MTSSDSRDVVHASMKISTRYFKTVTWPIIKKYFNNGNCELHTIEGDNHPICRSLDMFADADFLIETPTHIYLVANRVQYDKNCRNVPIRYERTSGVRTEWAKMEAAYEKNYAFANLTIVSYINREHDKLLSASIVRTKALYEWAKTHHDKLHPLTTGNCSIYRCYWDDLRDDIGDDLIVWEGTNGKIQYN